MISANDPRWGATLEYNIDDDGVWLVYGAQRINLGFWPTVEDAAEAIERLVP